MGLQSGVSRRTLGKLLTVLGAVMLTYYWMFFYVGVPLQTGARPGDSVVNIALEQDRLIGVLISIALIGLGTLLQLVKEAPTNQTLMGSWVIRPMQISGPSKSCPRCGYVTPMTAVRCPQCGLIPSYTALMVANWKPLLLYSSLAIFFVGTTAGTIIFVKDYEESKQPPAQRSHIGYPGDGALIPGQPYYQRN